MIFCLMKKTEDLCGHLSSSGIISRFGHLIIHLPLCDREILDSSYLFLVFFEDCYGVPIVVPWEWIVGDIGPYPF